MSIGEQQRLAFIRLFALFKYSPNERMNTLVMFDESTSAVDTKTEGIIYKLLHDLQIWFVTISHRLSLLKYHQKELKLYPPHPSHQTNTLSVQRNVDMTMEHPTVEYLTTVPVEEDIAGQMELANATTNSNQTDYVEAINSDSFLKVIRDVWNVIHLPFDSSDRTLRIQVMKDF